MRCALIFSTIFITGILLGGYLFHATQPRSFLTFNDCNTHCFKPKDVLGLIASVGIQKGILPGVLKETDKTIVINHPFPEAKTHYVIIPKKDIKNIGSVSTEDREYLVDAMTVIGELIRENNLQAYKVIIYGPEYQHVTYLHFHLIADN